MLNRIWQNARLILEDHWAAVLLPDCFYKWHNQKSSYWVMRSNGGHFLERLYVSLRDEVFWKSSRVTCFEGFVWHLHEWPEVKLWINRSYLISLPQCLSHPVLGPVQPGVRSLCFQSPFRKFFSVWIPSALLCLPQLLPCFPHTAAFPGEHSWTSFQPTLLFKTYMY